MRISTQRRTLILARPEGQLGNRLFLAATLIAHAQENNLRLWNPALGEYAGFFCGTRNGFFPVFPGDNQQQGAHSLPGKISCTLRSSLARLCDRAAHWLGATGSLPEQLRVLDITQSHDVEDREYDLGSTEFSNLCKGNGALVLRGWKFRAHDALRRQREQIKKIFLPLPAIAESVGEVIVHARAKAQRLVGVHVRQGDYREWLGGKYFFESSRYLDWMAQAAALWPGEKVAFLVCTNGSWDAQEVAGCPIFRGPGSPVGDLYALAECDAIMGPPSSFSLWASYYGNVPLHMLEDATQEVHPVTFTMHRGI